MKGLLVLVFAGGLLLASVSGATNSALPSGNLIQNPGAESVTSTGMPAGWLVDSNFTAARYGTDVPVSRSSDINGGSYYFAGGPNNALSHARQTINVAGAATEIDGGGVKATLSGYIGGFASQGDNGTVSAVFTDGAGTETGTMTIGPVTAADRGNVSKLVLRSATKAVPARTRAIQIVLTSTRTEGAYNDGYFDNLSLTLTQGAPPPTTGTTTTTPAGPSPVGLWKTNGRLYRWVKIPNGFEERSMTPHKLSRGCLVRLGDPVDRYYARGGDLYRVAYMYWRAKPGGPGKAGLNCTRTWHAPEATVKILVSASRMTVSCDDKPSRVCTRYTRAGA